MTVRTFKQQGAVFAPTGSSVNLQAKINGQEVFNGPVATLTKPVPVSNYTDEVIDLFSWDSDVSFFGEKELEISITGGTLILRDTVANYFYSMDTMSSSGPDNFGYIFVEKYNETDNIYTDPFINVKIDNVAQQSRPEDGPMGQWTWRVNSGSIFTATVRILKGTPVL